MSLPPEYTIRAAVRNDLPELEAFIGDFVKANRLLPRTKDELNELLPFGFVAMHADNLVGFAALEIYSHKLAEVRSLAVSESARGCGVGRELVEACVELARQKNVLEVMAITSAEAFFQNCGFDFTLPGEKKALFLQTRSEA